MSTIPYVQLSNNSTPQKLTNTDNTKITIFNNNGSLKDTKNLTTKIASTTFDLSHTDHCSDSFKKLIPANPDQTEPQNLTHNESETSIFEYSDSPSKQLKPDQKQYCQDYQEPIAQQNLIGWKFLKEPTSKSTFYNRFLAIDCFSTFFKKSLKFQNHKKLDYLNTHTIEFSKDNGEEFAYKGELLNDIPHGYGELYNKDTRVLYAGYFINGIMEGEGSLYNKHKNLIYGGIWKDDTFDGHGTIYNDLGQKIYMGDFKHGLANGYGTEFREDLELVYDGYWQYGYYQGNGKFYKHGLTFYVGDFCDGVAHGYGTIQYIDPYFSNTYYKGQLVKGCVNGFGTSYNFKGNKMYEGNWKYGVPDGFGQYFYKNGKPRYVGKLEDGKFNGTLNYYHKNGNIAMQCFCVDSRPYGAANVYYEGIANKVKFRGTYCNGRKAGWGTLMDKDNSILSCEHVDGISNGYGQKWVQKRPKKTNKNNSMGIFLGYKKIQMMGLS